MTYTARQINDILKALGQAQSAAAKQASGSAVAFALAEGKVREVGAALNDMYTAIVAKLSPNIITLGTSILNIIQKLVGSKGFQDTLTSVLNWVNSAFGSLLQSGNVTDFWQRLRVVFSDGFDQLWRWVRPVWENTIKPAAIGMFNSIVDFLTPYLRKAFNFVFDTVKSYIYDTTGGRFGSSKETNREISRQTEYYEDAKDKLAALQRRVKELDGRDSRDRVELNKVWADIWTAKTRVQKIYDAMNTGEPIPGFERSPAAEDILKPGGTGPASSQGLYLIQGISDYLKANPPNAIRALGTLGALGTPTEPKDVVAQLHQGERVLSQGEVGSLNNMGDALQRLNSLTAQLVIEMKENNRHTRDTLNATKNLGGNLYA
jgi:hypothetical protein